MIVDVICQFSKEQSSRPKHPGCLLSKPWEDSRDAVSVIPCPVLLDPDLTSSLSIVVGNMRRIVHQNINAPTGERELGAIGHNIWPHCKVDIDTEWLELAVFPKAPIITGAVHNPSHGLVLGVEGDRGFEKRGIVFLPDAPEDFREDRELFHFGQSNLNQS